MGWTLEFVQDNHSLSRDRGVLRGLHCQIGPYAQGKLVRCVRGAIWDVAVDARGNSPTFGQWVAAELSAENGKQFWVPAGFLHGFCTLAPDSEVLYKVTAPYNRESERGMHLERSDARAALAGRRGGGGPVREGPPAAALGRNAAAVLT